MDQDFSGRPLRPWQIEAMKSGSRLARKALLGEPPANFREYKNGRLTPEYQIWALMVWRSKRGGPAVCDRWCASYYAFLHDMGRRPDRGYHLKRIKDQGRFTPKNCEWRPIAKVRRAQESAKVSP
jgi:hypothetical protein